MMGFFCGIGVGAGFGVTFGAIFGAVLWRLANNDASKQFDQTWGPTGEVIGGDYDDDGEAWKRGKQCPECGKTHNWE
jgi:hypothetical protein